jgi:hypothetical protein
VTDVEVDSDELNEITEEARHPPDPEVLIALLNRSLAHSSQEFTPPGSDSSDEAGYTRDTTLRRLARYADQNSSLSNDENWVKEMKDDEDCYFTGSEDTSGGGKSDWSDYIDDDNTEHGANNSD